MVLMWMYVLIWETAEGCFLFSLFLSYLIVSFYFPFIWQGDDLHVSCYYIDCNLNAFAISSAQVSIMHASQNRAAWALFLLNYSFSLSGLVNRNVRNSDLNKAKLIYNDQLDYIKFEQVTVYAKLGNIVVDE